MDNPTKKTFKWDAEADRDLYAACLIIAGEPKGQTLGKAVELLRETKGVSYTVKAATHRMQHLQKLKRKEGATTEGATPSSTPAKAKGTPKKRGGKAAAIGDDDEDDAPLQKKRRGATKKETPSKAAFDDDDEDVKPYKAAKQEVPDHESDEGI